MRDVGSGERGDARLLRDLAAVELLVDRRPGAMTRLQRELGESTARALVASLAAALPRAAQRAAHG
jgi:hypothetical protein